MGCRASNGKGKILCFMFSSNGSTLAKTVGQRRKTMQMKYIPSILIGFIFLFIALLYASMASPHTYLVLDKFKTPSLQGSYSGVHYYFYSSRRIDAVNVYGYKSMMVSDSVWNVCKIYQIRTIDY